MFLPRYFILHLVSLAFALAIAFALIEPVPVRLETATQGMTFPIDKLVHFALFLAAAVPWRRSLAVLGVHSPGVAVVVAAAVYGGLLEIAQGLFMARDAEFLDMLAGALGAVAAVGIIRRVKAWPVRRYAVLSRTAISPKMRVERTFGEKTRVNHAGSSSRCPKR